MKPVIFISGPPRSGKSHAGKVLAEHLQGDSFALSDILKDLTHRHFSLDVSAAHYEDIKDTISDDFKGMTPREAYIWFSEEVIKPQFGQDALGVWALDRVKENQKNGKTSIITGVGFELEVAPIITEIGSDNCFMISVSADSHNHVKDSRHTLYGVDLGIDGTEVENSYCTNFDVEILSKVANLEDTMEPTF